MRKLVWHKAVRKRVIPLLLVMCMLLPILEWSGLSITTYAKEESTLQQNPDDRKRATGLEESYLEDLELQGTDEERADTYLQENANVVLPENVDNTAGENGKYFPAIGDQKSVGSCLYWAMDYYIKTYMFNRYFDREVDVTNTYSPKWGYANSTWLEGSVTLDRCPVTKFSSSVDTGDDFPADCEADWMQSEIGSTDAVVYILHGQNQEDKDVEIDGPDSEDLTKVKKSLSDGNVLGLITSAYWFNYSTLDASFCQGNQAYGGERIITACAGTKGSNKGGHAITIVGYNDNIGVDLNGNGILEKGEKGAFKVANSWGSNWCNDGYVWISYDALNPTSKYSKIGTGTNEQRESVAGAIVEIQLDSDRMEKEEPDYYAAITVNTCDKALYIESFKNPEAFFKPNHTFSCVSGKGYNKTLNYAGTTGYADATIVTEMPDSMENIQMYNWGNGTATVKEIRFVDNVHNCTYLGKSDTNIIEKSKSTEWKVDKTKTAPHFQKFDLNEKNGKIAVQSKASNMDKAMTYELSYVCESGEDSGKLSANTSGEFLFKGKEKGYYRVTVTATDEDNISTSKTKLVQVKSISDFEITDFTASKVSPVSVTDSIELKATVNCEGEEVQYRFGTIFNGIETIFHNGYSNSNICTVDFGNIFGMTNAKAVGTHTLFVDAKHVATGVVERKTIENYQVEGLKIVSLKADKPSPQKTGTEIKLSAEVENEATYRYNTYRFTVIKDGVETNVEPYNNTIRYDATWKPTEPGNYTVKYYIRDNYGQEAVKTLEYQIHSEKTATVYYENTSFTDAYIHYKVGNGNWTSVPGVKMEDNSTLDGYTWKYVIDLGEESEATVCFNNGNNSWDSKNGANYTVGEGTYGIKNGSVNRINLDVSVEILGTRGSTSARTIVKNGVAPYTYSYVFTGDGVNPTEGTRTWNLDTHVMSFSSYNGGMYGVYVVVTDAEGKTGTATDVKELPPLYIADINASVASPQKTGTTVTFTADIQSEYTYKFPNYRTWTISKDGTVYESTHNTSNKITYTFEEAGTYDITCVATDATQQRAEKTIRYVVSDETNVAVIYYNTGWDNAYIHYCVGNGAWTSVPGVKMTSATEQSGYNYKAVIELGEADSATVCFNNGNGSWDSRNGANYTVGKGTYGIKDGSVNKIDGGSPSNTATIYYSTGWDNAYIHYCIGDGAWTNVPGMKMTPATEQYGYNYKAVIELGEADSATVCFNNGNGSWDSKNGANYNIKAGTYGVKDGQIYKLQ